MTDSGLRQMLDRRADDAGIDHVHPHLFRHAFAQCLACQRGTGAGPDAAGGLAVQGDGRPVCRQRRGRARRARHTGAPPAGGPAVSHQATPGLEAPRPVFRGPSLPGHPGHARAGGPGHPTGPATPRAIIAVAPTTRRASRPAPGRPGHQLGCSASLRCARRHRRHDGCALPRTGLRWTSPGHDQQPRDRYRCPQRRVPTTQGLRARSLSVQVLGPHRRGPARATRCAIVGSPLTQRLERSERS